MVDMIVDLKVDLMVEGKGEGEKEWKAGKCGNCGERGEGMITSLMQERKWIMSLIISAISHFRSSPLNVERSTRCNNWDMKCLKSARGKGQWWRQGVHKVRDPKSHCQNAKLCIPLKRYWLAKRPRQSNFSSSNWNITDHWSFCLFVEVISNVFCNFLRCVLFRTGINRSLCFQCVFKSLKWFSSLLIADLCLLCGLFVNLASSRAPRRNLCLPIQTPQRSWAAADVNSPPALPCALLLLSLPPPCPHPISSPHFATAKENIMRAGMLMVDPLYQQTQPHTFSSGDSGRESSPCPGLNMKPWSGWKLSFVETVLKKPQSWAWLYTK